MLPYPLLWLCPLEPPIKAIDCPPRFNLGLQIRLSSSFSAGAGGLVPGSMMLLCDSFAGSLKATQKQSFAVISSVNKLSSLAIVVFEDISGAGTVSPIGIISFPRGGRKSPVKPGHPYEAASTSLCLGDFAVFPSCKTCWNFDARGWDEWRNT